MALLAFIAKSDARGFPGMCSFWLDIFSSSHDVCSDPGHGVYLKYLQAPLHCAEQTETRCLTFRFISKVLLPYATLGCV